MKKFTLIELLVVLAIIGILASLLMPSLQKARHEAVSAVCKSNMSQIAKTAMIYVNDNDSLLPEGYTDLRPFRSYMVKYKTKWLGVGILYDQLQIPPKVFYCPQLEDTPLNYYPIKKHAPEVFLLDHFMGTGVFAPNPLKPTTIRSSYSFLAESMSVKNRLMDLESDSLLVNDNTFFGGGTSHCRFNDFWNVAKADSSVSTVYSSKIGSLMTDFDGAVWGGAYTDVLDILKK